MLIAALLAVSLQPSSEGPTLAFPAHLVRTSPQTVDFALAPKAVARLAELTELTFADVPWGDGLDLVVERYVATGSESMLFVDGELRGRDSDSAASFWTGHVVGDETSDVFLAFAGGAAWGWIARTNELIHVVSRPSLAGDWSRGTTTFISESAYLAQGRGPRLRCDATTGTDARLDALAGTVPVTAGATSASPRPFVGDLALETDWQFFQLFGNLAVADGYARALIAAANQRFAEQIQTTLNLVYVGIWTHSADPWINQDIGGNCFDVLYEFQAAWANGGAPVQADLHHLFSGVDLGCAVAFIDALCDPERSFSLMSRMDGTTQFPVIPSPLNWDFTFMCHELGHNFASLHTHEYCPPLDECAPNSVWGPCQDIVACTNQATFMSYCHGCPGGIANYTTWFHPVVAGVMRAAVEASCFRPL